MSIPLHIIILAAGDGTRMKSRLPKVLHTVGGRPMIAHVLDTAASLAPAGMHVVYNPDAAEVRAACADWDVQWAPQSERLGTGHAVQQAMPNVPDDAEVMVLYGDIPLIPAEVLRTLIEAPDSALRILTMLLDEPRGYGRMLRDAAGHITGIVEEKEASPSQLSIREVNTGIILARAADLGRWLGQVQASDEAGEYYLTSVFEIAAAEGIEIASVQAPDPRDLSGANDRVQLAELEQRYRALAARRLMLSGVQIADPARIELRGRVTAGTDVFLDINVVLEGEVRLGDGVHIGPGCVLRDCRLAAGTRVQAHSVLEGVHTHGACEIGPFARLRPGTALAEGSKVGNFVEVKNTTLGDGSKASHLSYLGDSTIGKGVNIGAGTITCNYDGANKHQTLIGDGAFIGSDTQLVAPVTIGADATIGAGATITKDAPAGQLTLSRARQVTVKGWKRPKKGED